MRHVLSITAFCVTLYGAGWKGTGFEVLCKLFGIIVGKMADGEVSSELYSNLFHQNGLISSVNECVCCIDLNSKLKCASDEISSLNQIIQLLLNDLNSDCVPVSSDIDLSTLREIASMEKEHNMSTCDDWIEVTSKFSRNTNTVRNPDSLLAYQPIPTYNKYAHLINLQDSTET